MSLALAADLRWASDQANFSMAFAKIGLHPDWGGSVLLSRMVSPSKAMELMWTGDTLTADQALTLGLVNEVIASDQFEMVVAKKMARLAGAPRHLLASIKQSAQRNLGLDAASFKSLLLAEGEEMKRLMKSPDAQEGIRAFLEKRPPRFS
jgi:2-(1,2-epoxy-1,2-dihydrophenyl)acetyl-CoA isomerase